MKKLSDFQSQIHSERFIDGEERSLGDRSNSEQSFDDETTDESGDQRPNDSKNQITVKVKTKRNFSFESRKTFSFQFSIKEVRDLTQSDAENVICRYTFVNQKQEETIVSTKQILKDRQDEEDSKKPKIFIFNHEKVSRIREEKRKNETQRFSFCRSQEFTFTINENFISNCLESAVSIEVWNRFSSIPSSIVGNVNQEKNRRDAEIRALSNRWKEVKRHIQFAVEIHELDAAGRWEPVEVDGQQTQIISGGVYRLRQVNRCSLFRLKSLTRNSEQFEMTFLF